MRYHYTYRITNTLLNKHYYGTRTSKYITPLEDLGVIYFSSSKDKEFINDQKLNPQDYKYKIIRIFKTRKQALELEIKLHNKFNVGVNESFYNRSKQTSTGFDTTGLKMSEMRDYIVSDETKEKLRHANLGKKQSKETIEKRAKSLIGRECSKETRRKIGKSNSKKKRTPEEKQHLREINLGKITPREVKDKQSIAMKLYYKEHSREYSKVCCLKCKKEIAFNRISVHQNSSKCL